jgi:hypothetical protein
MNYLLEDLAELSAVLGFVALVLWLLMGGE